MQTGSAEHIRIGVDGRTVDVPSGTVVAAALAYAGVVRFRDSVVGQSRGPLCGMGICMECRVTIDGQSHCRSCELLCADGMEILTRPATASSVPTSDRNDPCEYAFDLVVVGAGPAGLAAASVAAEQGGRVGLVDGTPWLGGQIWRGQQARPSVPAARRWLERFGQSGATLLGSTTVVGSPTPGLLLAENAHGSCRIAYRRLILAPGARELFLPFPGWTLPGVIGPGGLLTLVKNGWPIRGRRVVVAGSGPLLLAVADGLGRAGATVISICEQAPGSRVVRFGLGLCFTPGKLWQAIGLRSRLVKVPYRCGVWPLRAEGDHQLRRVILTDGQRQWTEECDLLACGFGLVPNTELPLALGCELQNGFVRVNDWQQTTVANVWCAGEPTGIGGADCASVEGQIAGYAATDHRAKAQALFGQRAAWHRFRASLAKAFALRDELKSLAQDETLVCRCEDVTLGRMRAFDNWREAKLQTRCGMGACQGRVCGAAAQVVLGWGMESVRPPILPAQVASLISSRLAGESASSEHPLERTPANV